jgi:hypothetical protein
MYCTWSVPGFHKNKKQPSSYRDIGLVTPFLDQLWWKPYANYVQTVSKQRGNYFGVETVSKLVDVSAKNGENKIGLIYLSALVHVSTQSKMQEELPIRVVQV